MRGSSLAPSCLLAALVWPLAAEAAPGDLLVTESLGGSVLEWSRGGDLSHAQRFAFGLEQPTGICRGPEGHIYVVETGPGEITIIDDGGDMSAASPFAYGVPGMTGLWCNDQRILTGVFVGGVGVVLDVAAGGNITMIPPDQLRVAINPSLTTAVLIDDADTMFAVGGDVYDVTTGGDHTMDSAWAFGVALVPAMLHEGMTLGGQLHGPGIWDFTAGGDLSSAQPWATLPDHGPNGVEALLDAGDVGAFALVGNEIYEITGGGDLSLAAPIAFGLNAGLDGEDPLAGLEGMLHHVCSTDDDCNDSDLCNGEERCVDNACVLADGPADCDDADSCTADGCDPATGCSNEPIDGCCHDDFDCEIDEVCDVDAAACVPIDPTGGASSSEGGEDGSGGETSGPTDGTGTPGDTSPVSDGTDHSDTDEASAAGSSDGCGCTTGGAPSGVFGLAFVLGLAGARRRSRASSRSRRSC